MNNWITKERKRLLDGNNYQYGVPTKYAVRKEKLLAQLQWFEPSALKRQLELLEKQDTLEKGFKRQGGFSYSDLLYKRIFNKPFKIKVIKQILKHS